MYIFHYSGECLWFPILNRTSNFTEVAELFSLQKYEIILKNVTRDDKTSQLYTREIKNSQ